MSNIHGVTIGFFLNSYKLTLSLTGNFKSFRCVEVPGEGHGHNEGRRHVDLPNEVAQRSLKEQVQYELIRK